MQPEDPWRWLGTTRGPRSVLQEAGSEAKREGNRPVVLGGGGLGMRQRGENSFSRTVVLTFGAQGGSTGGLG